MQNPHKFVSEMKFRIPSNEKAGSIQHQPPLIGCNENPHLVQTVACDKFYPQFFLQFSTPHNSQTVWTMDPKVGGELLPMDLHLTMILFCFQLQRRAGYDRSKSGRFSRFSSECTARWHQFWLWPIEGVQTEVAAKVLDEFFGEIWTIFEMAHYENNTRAS